MCFLRDVSGRKLHKILVETCNISINIIHYGSILANPSEVLGANKFIYHAQQPDILDGEKNIISSLIPHDC